MARAAGVDLFQCDLTNSLIGHPLSILESIDRVPANQRDVALSDLPGQGLTVSARLRLSLLGRQLERLNARTSGFDDEHPRRSVAGYA